MLIAKILSPKLNKLLDVFCRIIVMKAKILSDKGTAFRVVDVEDSKWAGRSFYVVQEEFMGSLPSGTIISLGKGTGRVLAGQYPKMLKKIPDRGFTIATNKGTSSYRVP